MKNMLLPEPRMCRLLGGSVVLPHSLCVVRADNSVATRRQALLFVRDLRQSLNRPVTMPATSTRAVPGTIRLQITGTGAAEGYELTVGLRDIEVRGNDPAGLFYGLQTLRQLLRLYPTRMPCLLIRDEPGFRHRGYYLDISRGRVPRPATLRALVKELAALKMNQLYLYVEHVFAFDFDPEISAGCDPLRPAEIRALDRFCRERHIELVPSLACFGHMGRILSLPRYRALAEVPWPAPNWERAPWTLRLRGATLNPRHPGSQALLRRMLNEFLPLFSSPHFHMCGDETYDLGRGANARWARRHGRAALYLAHLRFVRRHAQEHGKRLMLWGDMLLQYPKAIPAVPRDCIILDWGYDRDTIFEKAGVFIRAGLETYVCPSTRGFKVVFNEIEEARANIAGYARAGARLGAAGLLVTDWGDIGHFNLPGCSAHGRALGAALAWNPASDERAPFDRAFSLQCLGDPSGRAATRLVRAGRTGLAEWPLLLQPPSAPPHPASLRRRARRLRPECRRWAWQFSRMKPTDGLSPLTLQEITLACEALALNAHRILIESDLVKSMGLTPAGRKRIRTFCSEVERFFRKYARVWRPAYRPAGLRDLEQALRQAVGRLRRAAAGPPIEERSS